MKESKDVDPDTENSIVRREELTRGRLRNSQPTADGSTTPVYVDRRGRNYVADRPLTAAEIWFDPPQAVYIVDTAVHTTTFQHDLPTREEAFSFAAAVTVSWQVHEPNDAVETGLANAEDVYKPILLEQMRKISRQFDVESSAEAERAVNSAYAERSADLPQGLLLRRCTVTLSLDAEARQHIAKRTVAARAREDRERQHAETLAESERALKESEREHELATLQAKHRHDLERQAEAHTVELNKMRMDFYADALRQGSLGLFAMRMNQNPQDVDGVIKLIMQEYAMSFDAAREFLRTAMEGGAVNPRHVAGAVAQAADSLTRMMRRADGGLAALPDGAALHVPADGSDKDVPGPERPLLASPGQTAPQRATSGDTVPPARADKDDDDDPPV